MREQDLRDGRTHAGIMEFRRTIALLLEAIDDRLQVLLQHVVAEVDDEVVIAEERMRDPHAVGKAERRLLRDVLDLDPEP